MGDSLQVEHTSHFTHILRKSSNIYWSNTFCNFFSSKRTLPPVVKGHCPQIGVTAKESRTLFSSIIIYNVLLTLLIERVNFLPPTHFQALLESTVDLFSIMKLFMIGFCFFPTMYLVSGCLQLRRFPIKS
jgi:hypothetical protein